VRYALAHDRCADRRVDDHRGVAAERLKRRRARVPAFRRVRYTSSPGARLRLLLFHAVNGSGLRETVVQAKATRRMRRNSQRKQHQLTQRSLPAAHFVLIFATLSRDTLDAAGVLELYRGHWQIERSLSVSNNSSRSGMFRTSSPPSRTAGSPPSWSPPSSPNTNVWPGARAV